MVRGRALWISLFVENPGNLALSQTPISSWTHDLDAPQDALQPSSKCHSTACFKTYCYVLLHLQFQYLASIEPVHVWTVSQEAEYTLRAALVGTEPSGIPNPNCPTTLPLQAMDRFQSPCLYGTMCDAQFPLGTEDAFPRIIGSKESPLISLHASSPYEDVQSNHVTKGRREISVDKYSSQAVLCCALASNTVISWPAHLFH
ncbi:hypothetical protein F5Y03DRAFT_59351 [Xylaria venustula]|nr:hypothetical protein F5Y03DRAFT_59351 [Xylaria venustula]